jgi:phosphatidate cytidylyltransferase
LSILFLVLPVEFETAPHRLALGIFGLLYTGLLFTFVMGVGLLKAGPAWTLMLLAISWLNDTGGYFAGRFLGGKIFRNKLYPQVSPKKTWEGFCGGLVGSFVAVVLAKLWFFPLGYAYAGFGPGQGPNLSWLDCVFLAIPAGAIGVTGDLVESLFKRAFHVKDSGNILPGHGGMLDRVDAVLFAAPFVFLYGRYFFDA